KKSIITAAVLVAAAYAGQSLAHSAGATIDAAGNNASATDLAEVFCYNDGSGEPDQLFVQIRDNSSPVAGLLLSAQIYKDNQMTNTTDTVSGDSGYSNSAVVKGGFGGYNISVSKTKAGARDFDITYHCLTSGDVHTGTDITVFQAQ
ncbi:MAG: hypothetical protein ACOYMG_09775, partial [Candidatus Methylumidiphilus sp.]